MSTEDIAVTDIESMTYEKSWLVDLFHQFPHIDLSFQFTNATFDLSDPSYTQALMILGFIPVVWLALTCLLLFIFVLCQCCSTPDKKKKKVTCRILGILCCGALAVGLYGNEGANRGVHDFVDSFTSADETFKSVDNETQSLQRTLEVNVTYDLENFYQLFEEPISNSTVHDLLIKNLDDMSVERERIVRKLNRVTNSTGEIDMTEVPKKTAYYEFIRWAVMIGLQCWQALLCIFIFRAIARDSKGMLMSFAALAVFTLLFSWCQGGAYLASSVALADLCLNPEPFIEHQAGTDIEQDVMQYYLDCYSESSPFAKDLKQAHNILKSLQQTLHELANEAAPFYDQAELDPLVNSLSYDLNGALISLEHLDVLLDCSIVHEHIIKALTSICTSTIVGSAFMLVAAVAAGLILTLMICVTSRTWIHIHRKSASRRSTEEKQRRGYYMVDEESLMVDLLWLTEEFLPSRPPPNPAERYGSLVGFSNPQPVFLGNRSEEPSAPNRHSLASTVPEDNSPPPADIGMARKLQEVFEVKFAKMPDEPLNSLNEEDMKTESDSASSSGSGDDAGEADDSDDDERERRLQQLQAQVCQ